MSNIRSSVKKVNDRQMEFLKHQPLGSLMNSLIALCLFTIVTILMTPGHLKASLSSGQTKTTIEFPSLDNLPITADLYFDKDKKKPFILFFHQAGFSRGEYKHTALLFTRMGFNAMAVDQRSGQWSNGIRNKTAARAVKKNLKTHYLSAEQDMQAAVKYVKNKLKVKNIILWGSSYSASLVLKIAGEKKYDYMAVVSFSPGEYFGKKNFIRSYAKKIKIPVWLTSSKSEIKRTDQLFSAISSKNKVFFKPTKKGEHGSKALWKSGSGYKDYRNSLFSFLKKL